MTWSVEFSILNGRKGLTVDFDPGRAAKYPGEVVLGRGDDSRRESARRGRLLRALNGVAKRGIVAFALSDTSVDVGSGSDADKWPQTTLLRKRLGNSPLSFSVKRPRNRSVLSYWFSALFAAALSIHAMAGPTKTKMGELSRGNARNTTDGH